MIDLNYLDERYSLAIEYFGKDVVEEIVEMMKFIGDPDVVFNSYKNKNLYKHTECVIFLYLDGKYYQSTL